jgi:hypothetical protein
MELQGGPSGNQPSAHPSKQKLSILLHPNNNTSRVGSQCTPSDALGRPGALWGALGRPGAPWCAHFQVNKQKMKRVLFAPPGRYGYKIMVYRDEQLEPIKTPVLVIVDGAPEGAPERPKTSHGASGGTQRKLDPVQIQSITNC